MDLTSVVSYPDRGPYGDWRYRGNCSGRLIKDLIKFYKPKSVLDPCEGGRTARDVCKGTEGQRLGQTVGIKVHPEKHQHESTEGLVHTKRFLYDYVR